MDGIIGREIQRARLNLGWSRATLADECGITISDLESIENGDRGEHVDRVLAVLQLEVVTMIMPQAHADFLRAVRPIIAGVPPERLALAFGAIMSALGGATVAGQTITTRLNIPAPDADDRDAG